MSIYIPNITLKDIKKHPVRFLIGSKGVTLEVTDVYGNSLSENVVQEVAAHGRLIDAYAFVSDLIFPNESFERAFKEMVDDAPTVIEAEE